MLSATSSGTFSPSIVVAKLRHGFVEQAVEGGGDCHRLFEEELLQLVVELVGLVLAQIDDPGPVMAGSRIVRHAGVDHRVVDAVQFQREEQQMAGNVGDLGLHVAVELAVCRIGGVGEIGEAGEGADAADQIVERLVFPQRRADALGAGLRRGLRQLALPFFFEGDGGLAGLFHVGDEGGGGRGGVEILQLPDRQVAERRIGGGSRQLLPKNEDRRAGA